jgi:hypothetical protein
MTTETTMAARGEIDNVSGGFFGGGILEVLAIGAVISFVMYLTTGKVKVQIKGTF